MDNLFAGLPRSTLENEQFCELLARPGLRIERIVSTGQASPEGFWYDQPDGEWVLLIQGEAGLRFTDEAEARHLRAGDFVTWTLPRIAATALTGRERTADDLAGGALPLGGSAQPPRQLHCLKQGRSCSAQSPPPQRYCQAIPIRS